MKIATIPDASGSRIDSIYPNISLEPRNSIAKERNRIRK